jgi:DNA-binding response OmpR family regulator
LPPVVAMTAYATQEKRAEILAAGVMAFVSKPVDDRKLAATLQAVLGGTPQIEGLDEASDDATGDTPSAGDSLRIDRLNALGEPSAVVGRFVQDFGDAWEKIVRTWREQPETAAADAHRMRTQALLVEARGLSRQLGLLELALADPQRASDAGPLVDAISREVTRVLTEVTALAKAG